MVKIAVQAYGNGDCEIALALAGPLIRWDERASRPDGDLVWGHGDVQRVEIEFVRGDLVPRLDPDLELALVRERLEALRPPDVALRERRVLEELTVLVPIPLRGLDRGGRFDHQIPLRVAARQCDPGRAAVLVDSRREDARVDGVAGLNRR